MTQYEAREDQYPNFLPPADEDVNTLYDLVREVQNAKTGGYEVEFDIQPNSDRGRVIDKEGITTGFFLIIRVESNEPLTTPAHPRDPIDYGHTANGNPNINGEWWFWGDGTVMQVL